MDYSVLELERLADPDGQWIPLAVRMKLDSAGLKMSLEDWQALEATERQRLLTAPAETTAEDEGFAHELRAAFTASRRGHPAALPQHKCASLVYWQDPGPVPEAVAAMLPPGQRSVWQTLDGFGRYVAYALAAKGDGERLGAALRQLERRECK